MSENRMTCLGKQRLPVAKYQGLSFDCLPADGVSKCANFRGERSWQESDLFFCSQTRIYRGPTQKENW